MRHILLTAFAFFASLCAIRYDVSVSAVFLEHHRTTALSRTPAGPMNQPAGLSGGLERRGKLEKEKEARRREAEAAARKEEEERHLTAGMLLSINGEPIPTDKR